MSLQPRAAGLRVGVRATIARQFAVQDKLGVDPGIEIPAVVVMELCKKVWRRQVAADELHDMFHFHGWCGAVSKMTQAQTHDHLEPRQMGDAECHELGQPTWAKCFYV